MFHFWKADILFWIIQSSGFCVALFLLSWIFRTKKVDGKADERSFLVFEPHTSSKRDFDGESSSTVDGQNPANQLRLVVYPIIYDGF